MSDDDHPDPEAFKAMRHQGSGSMTVDDFVGGHGGNTGRTKFEKKWKPKKAEDGERFGRVDDWVGGSPTGAKRSWKVKSPSKSSVPADTHEQDAVVASPTRKWKPPPKDDAVPPPWIGSPSSKPKSPSKWTPKSPSMTSPSSTNNAAKPAVEHIPPPPHGSPEQASSVRETTATKEATDDVYKPDPNEFKRMNDQHEAGGAKNDDYVGSTSNTGRTKYEKKWKPQKPEAGDSAARVDDWVGGSPTGARRSWKPKSPTKSPTKSASGNHHDDHHVVASPTRRWKPPPKEDAVPPPWMVSPSSKPKSPTKWKPKSPSKTSASNRGNEPTAEAADIGVPPPPHGSPDPSPKKETTKEADTYKPDPSEYKKMNDLHEAGGAKNDDFVGGTSNTGRSKFAKKKWTPTKPDVGDTAARVDDWAGGATCSKRGWKVKSVSAKPRSEVEEEVEEPVSEPVSSPKPETTPPKESEEPECDEADMNTKDDEAEGEPVSNSTSSDAKESGPEEGPVAVSDDDDQDEKKVIETNSPAVQATTENSVGGSEGEIYKPDPSHFIQMRNIDEAAGSRVDDYVGGSGSNTGRSKFNKKKWTPAKPDAGDTAARVDDWAGGTTCTKRGYKVKSVK